MRDCQKTLLATVPRHWQFSVRYVDEDTLEIAFLRPTKALAAFGKIKANLKDEENK